MLHAKVDFFPQRNKRTYRFGKEWGNFSFKNPIVTTCMQYPIVVVTEIHVNVNMAVRAIVQPNQSSL